MTTTPSTPSTPSTSSTPSTVTESRFTALKKKLRELFELDKSDLDFGIYRIMAAKNKEVTDFLDRQLKDVVRETLAGHGVTAVAQIDAEIAEARQAAQDAGFNPDDSPKVKELQAKRDTIGGGTAAELEADIYNHLLAFFSRYYDEGDFISKRRYKGDTYAIPYSGEEVVLHWANKDQYYIKSGEWHKDYRFKIGGKTTRVRLLQATQEAANNKEDDDAKRRFILCAGNPVDTDNSNELVLHFEFRVPTDEEKTAVADAEATRIFGGKYDKPSGRTKGDEREQFAAHAEKIALDALPVVWKNLLGQPSPTDSKPNRTILGKHLNDFTAKNSFDYFIHKDLGGFLGRELDFYIKNEVVRLDDLESLDEHHLVRVQGKIKAIRRVASRIIEFLAALENFQKKLWLKKKLVLETNWLVTIDRVPDKLRDVVAECKEQWEEWESLGFKPDADDASGLFNDAEWGTRAYLDACDKLVVDTRFFNASFNGNLMASEDVLQGHSSIEDAITGVQIHSSNIDALRLIESRYRGQIKCAFYDPPYNTGGDDFVYKDACQHSSWLAMMQQVVLQTWLVLADDGFVWVTLDDTEAERFTVAAQAWMNDHCLLPRIAWQHSIQGKGYEGSISLHHNSVIGMRRSEVAAVGVLTREEKHNKAYGNPDNDPKGDWRTGDVRNALFRHNLRYDIVTPSGGLIAHPDNGWRWSKETMQSKIDSGEVFFSKDEARIIRKIYLADQAGRVPESIWFGDDVGTSRSANREIKWLFGDVPFPTPKPTALVAQTCHLSQVGEVIDAFAGSGTTGHAVMNLNRADGGKRRFILVEMGAYFDTVLRPRIAKIIYSPDWKDGQSQAHNQGISALVKSFAVESYEDALNNLPAPKGSLLKDADDATRDALITYALDLELGPHLLNLDAFRDPWGYTINAQPAGDDEIRPHAVDLVETFNYLLGLKVHAYGPIEKWSAEFERADHEDGLGRLKIAGRIRPDPDGPFVFQRVEGVLNDSDNTRVLVVWRKLTDDPEQDAAVLDAWMARYREDTKERSEHRDYQQIYINGPVTLPQPTQELRTVYPTEEAFKAKMFEDTEGGA